MNTGTNTQFISKKKQKKSYESYPWMFQKLNMRAIIGQNTDQTPLMDFQQQSVSIPRTIILTGGGDDTLVLPYSKLPAVLLKKAQLKKNSSYQNFSNQGIP